MCQYGWSPWDEPDELVDRHAALAELVFFLVDALMRPLSRTEILEQAERLLEDAWAVWSSAEIARALVDWEADGIVVVGNGFASRHPPTTIRESFIRMTAARHAADRVADAGPANDRAG